MLLERTRLIIAKFVTGFHKHEAHKGKKRADLQLGLDAMFSYHQPLF